MKVYLTIAAQPPILFDWCSINSCHYFGIRILRTAIYCLFRLYTFGSKSRSPTLYNKPEQFAAAAVSFWHFLYRSRFFVALLAFDLMLPASTSVIKPHGTGNHGCRVLCVRDSEKCRSEKRKVQSATGFVLLGRWATAAPLCEPIQLISRRLKLV